jgi:hypothetical protein
MSKHPLPLALPLLALLVACSPSTPDAPPAPPAPGAAATSAAAIPPTPAKSAAALPAWMNGAWEPYSNSYMALGTLTVDNGTISWKGCTKARVSVLETSDTTVLLAIDPTSACLLNDIPPSQVGALRMTRRESGCEMGVDAFKSTAAAKSDDLMASGLYGRATCPAG